MADYDAYYGSGMRKAIDPRGEELWDRQLAPFPILPYYKINLMIMEQEMKNSNFEERDFDSTILWKGADFGIKAAAVTRNKVQK